jgi:hypothetical protein
MRWPGALETFRAQREEAQRMLASLPPKLTRMEAEREPGSSERALPAAAVETYKQALQESQKQPSNWLLVYDLLADVSECLEQIENPSMRTPYRPARYWSGDIDSPAAGRVGDVLCVAGGVVARGVVTGGSVLGRRLLR